MPYRGGPLRPAYQAERVARRVGVDVGGVRDPPAADGQHQRGGGVRISTITSMWNCCGRAGSGQTGGWYSGASWKANPDVWSFSAITTQSSEWYVMGRPSSSE